jgi:electron transfer flavoprotein alpha subunit
MKPAEADRTRRGTVVIKQFSEDYFTTRIKKLKYIPDETQQVAIQDSKVVISEAEVLESRTTSSCSRRWLTF